MIQLPRCYQALEIETLDLDFNLTDAKSSARWVIGSGPTTYQRQCSIWEYKSHKANFPSRK